MRSMTAFGQGILEEGRVALTVEMRSVNHRYLDLSFKLPERFRQYEGAFRDLIRQHVVRGKVECALRYDIQKSCVPAFEVNVAMVEKIIAANKVLSQFEEIDSRLDSRAVMQWPGVLESPDVCEEMEAPALKAVKLACENLLQARESEGNKILVFIDERLQTMKSLVDPLKETVPAIVKAKQDKLKALFAEANLALEAERLEQEMVMLAQRLDVDEEIDRLHAHIEEVRKIIRKKESVGRRLDFLMQEMNREANTLGSKSQDMQTTHVAVECKVLIEQMREQIQNIE